MNLPFNLDQTSSFYLIVKTFESLYSEFERHLNAGEKIYSIPSKGVNPGEVRKQYRGVDREPLSAIKRSRYLFYMKYLKFKFFTRGLEDIDAQDFMYQLEKDGRAFIDFIFEYEDAVHTFTKIQNTNRYEIIWVRKEDNKLEGPKNSSLLGYDATYFIGDHFSAIADSMFFPRYHGTDREGTLFRDYYECLNNNGLFKSAKEAHEFLNFYLSQDWTEQGIFEVAEVREVPAKYA